jgi:hypothetical protein
MGNGGEDQYRNGNWQIEAASAARSPSLFFHPAASGGRIEGDVDGGGNSRSVTELSQSILRGFQPPKIAGVFVPQCIMFSVSG